MFALLVFAWLAIFPVKSEELSTEFQVELQSAMLQFTESILVDGGYSYVDTKEGVLKTVYPANVHPFIVTMGDDYFVCSEMIDDAGKSINADFLVRRIDDQYKVVQLIMDNRQAVQGAISKLGK
ncbi:hypothetical protein HPQ64_05230 [Rhizobiales bacterium]|uniref:hypothetical protein n=1 Tax=Hongsoonwoonella zoysiae TaxID=2821844 RepID=UPI0015600CC5|nr:hypothetical protein [Hongsoonwoonella zoysiae]NRG17084.1 hypothetical protein [Hongsoonwoonella zoysiae]